MKTEEFIDILEHRRLVSSRIARQLRDKVAQGEHRITSETILKYLVKKELVSKRQAKELIETTLTVRPSAESSILGLAPLPDVSDKPAKAPHLPVVDAADDDDEPVPLQPLTKQSSAKPKSETAKPSAAGLPGSPPLTADDAFFESDVQPLDEIEPTEASLGLDEERTAPSVVAPRLKTRSKASKKSKPVKRPKKDRGKNQWDAPFLLWGGGGLVVLLGVGVLLYYLLFREGADAHLAKADQSFKSGAYERAIEQYDEFVVRYGQHQDYSRAKVRRELARLWQAVESGGNPGLALDVAESAISNMENEPAFISDADGDSSGSKDQAGLSDAKRQLSAALTQIVKSAAEHAESAKNETEASEHVKHLETALALSANTKYVPEPFRNVAALDAARETLDRVRIRQQRQSDLAAALKQMDEAVAGDDTAAAFAVRATLLRRYPRLAENPQLAEKVDEISDAAKALVKFVESPKAAAASPPATPVIAALAFAERGGQPATASGDGEVAVVSVDGALYGLNATDGALLWRRFTGAPPEAAPLTLEEGRIVAVEPASGGLACRDRASGELRWRLEIDDQLTNPIAAGKRILVGGKSGKLFVVDGANGALAGYVQLPQPISTPPVVNDRGDRIYLVAGQSIIVTLAQADMSCLGVFYLGHAAGAVVTPPLVVFNKVVVAENSGAETCRIRVLSLNEQGVVENEIAGHRLDGLVLTPLAQAGRRFAAVTSLGQSAVFEMGASQDAKALALLAGRDAPRQAPLAQFALLHDGHLWMAGRQLTKLAVLPTGNQLSVRSIDRDYHGDAFDAPLTAVENLVIHVRRPAGRGGAIVAAMDASNDKAAWDTAIAVPLAGPPAVDPQRGRIAAATAAGAAFVADLRSFSRGVHDQAAHSSQPGAIAAPLTDALDLGAGRLAAAAVGQKSLLHFAPDDPRKAARSVALPGPLSCPLVGWRGGIVAATDVGQVHLLDSATAEKMASPFQPELDPNRSYKWLEPAVFGEGDSSRLIVSDGVAKIYSIEYQSQPQPHLKAALAVDVGPAALDTRLAVVGERVLAGTASGSLASFQLPELTPDDPLPIGGRVAWGPHSTPAGVLLATDAGELMLVGGDRSLAWRRKLEHGPLGSKPLVESGAVVLLHVGSGLSRVNLADGVEAAFTPIQQRPVAGPVALGERWVLVAADGSLLVVNR